MFFVYYDESGDDGWPKYSSPLFAQTGTYFYKTLWRDNYEKIKVFRRWVRDKTGLLMRHEIHTKYFLLNKNPYRKLGLSVNERIEIIDRYCEAVAHLNARIINVVIHREIIKKEDYRVLHTALVYSITRINTDIEVFIKENPELHHTHFLIITDDGRVAKMRRTTRQIQIFNPTPSKFTPGLVVDNPIHRLLEDPLPKASQTSYFIQVSDLVAYIVYLYMLRRITPHKPTSRLPEEITHEKVIEWLDVLTPVLNLEASTQNEHGYGIVCYPKE